MTVNPKTLRRGLYRVKMPDGSGMEDYAQVKDVNGGNEMPMDESVYRQHGHDPAWEDLPWRDEYFAAQAETEKK